MKRTPELRALSEDHHHGLVHARRLRRAAEGDEVYLVGGFYPFPLAPSLLPDATDFQDYKPSF